MQMALLGSVRVFRGRCVFLRQLQLAQPEPGPAPRRRARVCTHEPALAVCGVRLGGHGWWRRGGLAVAWLLSVREIGHRVGRILKWRDLRKRADLRNAALRYKFREYKSLGTGLRLEQDDVRTDHAGGGNDYQRQQDQMDAVLFEVNQAPQRTPIQFPYLSVGISPTCAPRGTRRPSLRCLRGGREKVLSSPPSRTLRA